MPDASHIVDLPRRMYLEIRILLEFFLAQQLPSRESTIESLGDVVFDYMRNDQLYRLGVMLKGGSSFTSMGKSALARFESNATKAPMTALKKVMMPKLSINITPETKVMVKSEVAVEANLLHPAPRELQRVIARRKNPRLRILNGSLISDSIFGIPIDDLNSYLKKEIADAEAAKTLVLAIVCCFSKLQQRMSRKCRSMLQSKADESGESKGTRGTLIADYVNKQRLLGRHIKPAVLLLRTGVSRDNMKMMSKRPMKLDGILELLIFQEVTSPEMTFVDKPKIENIFVICRSNRTFGSFGGSSILDIGVLHHLLIDRVGGQCH